MHDDPARAIAPSDALVLFGVTGDLAYKRILPALCAMCKRGALKVPVIGGASSAWSIEQLRARAKESVESTAVPDRGRPVLSVLHYVGGNYNDAGTFEALKQALGGARRPAHYLAIPPAAWTVVEPVLAEHPRATSYPPGSWGPPEADRLIAADGGWHNPEPAR